MYNFKEENYLYHITSSHPKRTLLCRILLSKGEEEVDKYVR